MKEMQHMLVSTDFDYDSDTRGLAAAWLQLGVIPHLATLNLPPLHTPPPQESDDAEERRHAGRSLGGKVGSGEERKSYMVVGPRYLTAAVLHCCRLHRALLLPTPLSLQPMQISQCERHGQEDLAQELRDLKEKYKHEK